MTFWGKEPRTDVNHGWSGPSTDDAGKNMPRLPFRGSDGAGDAYVLASSIAPRGARTP